MKTQSRVLTSLLLLMCICGRINLYSQSTSAGFTGHVVNRNGSPVPDATVTVKNESTGFRNISKTNGKGEYLFKELPLGSPYTVIVTSIGYTEQIKKDFALNQGDQILVDFTMKEASAELQSVTVVSNSLKNRIKEIGSSTAVSSRAIAKLPVNCRNFTSLIDLSPLSRGGNLSGQLASATNYTIDGMAARGTISGGQPSGAYSVPFLPM